MENEEDTINASHNIKPQEPHLNDHIQAEPDLLVGHTMSSSVNASDNASVADAMDSRGAPSPDSLQLSADPSQDGLDDMRNSQDGLDDKGECQGDMNDTKAALRLSKANLSNNSSSPALSPRETDRMEKLRLMKEKQQKEQDRKFEELREAQKQAQEFREKQQEERRKKIDELRRRDQERRQAVEERRRQAEALESERKEALLKRQSEREQKIESLKSAWRRESRPLAFGSRTPREVCVVDSSIRRSPSMSFVTTGSPAKKRLSRSVPPRPHSCVHFERGVHNESPPRRQRPRSVVGAPVLSATETQTPSPGDASSTRRGRSTQRTSTFTSRSRSMGAVPLNLSASTPNVEKPREKKTPTPRAPLHSLEKLTSPRRAPTSPRDKVERVPSKGPVKVMPVISKPKPEKPTSVVPGKPDVKVEKSASSKPEEKAKPGLTPEEMEYKAKLAERRRLAREKAAKGVDVKGSTSDLNSPDDDDNGDLRDELEVAKNDEDEDADEDKVDEEVLKEQERLIEESRKAEEERLQKAIEAEEERKRLEAEKAEEERIQKEEAEKKAKEEAEKLEQERLEKARKEEEERNERKKRLEMIMKRVKNDASPIPGRAASPAPEPEVSRVVEGMVAVAVDSGRSLKSPEPEKFKSQYLQSIMQKRQSAAGGVSPRSQSPEEKSDETAADTKSEIVINENGDEVVNENGNEVDDRHDEDSIMKPVDNEEEKSVGESPVDSPSAEQPSDHNLDQIIELDNQPQNLSKNGDLSDILNFNTVSSEQTTRIAFEDNGHMNDSTNASEVEVS